jgi:hypothetical protein
MLVSLVVVVSFGFTWFCGLGGRLKEERMGKYVLFGRFWGVSNFGHSWIRKIY